MVTYFFAEVKARGVKFFSAVHRPPRQKSHIFVNFAPKKPKSGRIGQRTGHTHRDVNITVEMRRGKSLARDAPFVEYRTACGRMIGMYGYRSVPTDVLVYLLIYLLTYLLGCGAQTTRASNAHSGSGCQVRRRATSSSVRGRRGSMHSGNARPTTGTC